MKSPTVFSRQRGFTTGCVLVTLAFLGLSAFIGLRLGGPYVEYRILIGAMNDVVKHEDFSTASAGNIVSRIDQSVTRNSGVSPSTLELRKIIYVIVRDGKKVVGVNYEVSTLVYGNLSALMHFKHEATQER